MIARANHMQKQARRGRIFGFCAIFAIGVMFVAIAAISFAAAAERRQAEALHVHTLDVLLVVGQLETAVNAAARGERGYLITGDREFLRTYFGGRTQAFRLLRQLRRLTGDNAVQGRNLVRVEAPLRDYVSGVDRVVALDTVGRRSEAVAIDRVVQGRRQITDFLTALNRVEIEEHRLLESRHAASLRADAESQADNWIIIAVGGVLMALLTLAIASAGDAHRRAIELAEALHRLATTDMLTGLSNRRQLMFTIETEVRRAGRNGRPLALALLDVDRFKAVNDRHGHPAGDEVLRAVADELRRVTRGGDVLGRFGGEEFAIIMPETTIHQAHLACERLRKSVARRIMHYPDGTSGHVTISSGVALLAGEEGCDHLVSRADAALYEAKAEGRNRVRLAA